MNTSTTSSVCGSFAARLLIGLKVNFKEIRQYKVFHIFALMILSGAFCLLNADNVSAQMTDLAITKSAPANVNAGANIAYTISVTNNGPDSTLPSGGGFVDFIPANTTFVSIMQNFGQLFNCSRQPGPPERIVCTPGGSFPALASASFTLVLKVNPGTPAGTVIFNTATIRDEFLNDPNPENNASTTTTVVLLGPTAAAITVSGRVRTQGGRGIMNVRLSLTDSQGNVRTARTTSFGFYRFDDVQADQTVIITARAKRFTFNQSSIVRTTNNPISDADFVSEQ